MGLCVSKGAIETITPHDLTENQRRQLRQLTKATQSRLIEVESHIDNFDIGSKVLKIREKENASLRGTLLKFYNKAKTLSQNKVTHRRLIMILEAHCKKISHKLLISFYDKFKNTDTRDNAHKMIHPRIQYLNLLRYVFELFVCYGHIKCMEILVKSNPNALQNLKNGLKIGIKRKKYQKSKDPCYRTKMWNETYFEEFIDVMYDRKVYQYVNMGNVILEFDEESGTKSRNNSVSFKSVDFRSRNDSISEFDAIQI